MVHGITERHNVIFGNLISKLLLDENNKYPTEIIVAWAVSASITVRDIAQIS